MGINFWIIVRPSNINPYRDFYEMCTPIFGYFSKKIPKRRIYLSFTEYLTKEQENLNDSKPLIRHSRSDIVLKKIRERGAASFLKYQ